MRKANRKLKGKIPDKKSLSTNKPRGTASVKGFIKNLTTQIEPNFAEKNDSKNIVNYNLCIDNRIVENIYPAQVLHWAYNSDTAKACLDTKAKYIAGAGFVSTATGEIQINNDGTKLKDLLPNIAEDIAYHKAIGLKVRYNRDKKSTRIIDFPVRGLRWELPEENTTTTTKLHYNPYFGTFQHEEQFTQIFNEFNPKKITSKDIIDGQMLYATTTHLTNEFYPYPWSENDIEVFRTDTLLTKFNYNNLDNNFFLGAIMNVIGKHPDDIAYYEKPDTEEFPVTVREALELTLEQLRGAPNAGTILVNYVKNIEEQTTITGIPNNTNADLFEATKDGNTDKIARITKVPLILANIQVAGKLGNSQEISDQIQLLNNTVDSDQKFITSHLEKIFEPWSFDPNFPIPADLDRDNIDFTIKKLRPITTITDREWDVLTPVEQRRWIGMNRDIELDEDEEFPSPSKQERESKTIEEDA